MEKLIPITPTTYFNFEIMHSNNKMQKADFWETLEINKYKNTGDLLSTNKYS